jgi:hypothetical protein
MQQLKQAPAPTGQATGSSTAELAVRRADDSTRKIRYRVGAALDIDPDFIEIEGSRVSPSGWTMRCTGTARSSRFCAKIYLVDLYPVPARFAVPAEELHHRAEVCRPVEEQIATEWKRIQQMRTLVGGRNSPGPLGYSLVTRTVVFEEVKGVRADYLARWAWPATQRLKATEKAVFHAGAWLRNLHQVSFRTCESVAPIEVLKQAHRAVALKHAESTPQDRSSLQPLEAACRQIGPRTPIRVPIAMNHGDFSLANFIWDEGSEHLWVLDFELSSYRSILHDLGTIVFDLRKRLLHPLTSPRAIRRLEQSFWFGYGSIAPNLRLLVNALASHRLLYYSVPRISTLRARRGWKGGVKSLIYKGIFQHFMVSRILRAG